MKKLFFIEKVQDTRIKSVRVLDLNLNLSQQEFNLAVKKIIGGETEFIISNKLKVRLDEIEKNIAYISFKLLSVEDIAELEAEQAEERALVEAEFDWCRFGYAA